MDGNGAVTPPGPLEPIIIIELIGDGAVVLVAVLKDESPSAGDCVEEAWKAPPPWLTVRLRMGREEGGVTASPSPSVKAGETALAEEVSTWPPQPLPLPLPLPAVLGGTVAPVCPAALACGVVALLLRWRSSDSGAGGE